MTAPSDPVAIIALALNGAATITANISAATTNLITTLWRRVNPYDPLQVDAFKAQAGQIIISSQNSVASAHAGAQLMQLRALGINQNVAVKIPDNVRGQSVTFGTKMVQIHAATNAIVIYQKSAPSTSDAPVPTSTTVEQAIAKSDAAPAEIFGRAVQTYRYQKSIGVQSSTANVVAETRIARIVDNNLILAQRLAEQQTLSLVKALDKRVHGYRRVIHPEMSIGGVCGLCVAASSRRYRISELKPIHDRCRCSIAPITEGDDIGDVLNGQDLNNLYDAAGSTSGRDLKRTRFALQHHHELGPVLTRVKGEKVPYYSTTPVDLDAAATAASPS